MDSTLDSEWLATFSVFASCLNLTRTAEARHLSQPAIHLQLQKLSAALEAPLYRKIGRRLELTEAGRRTAGFAADQRDRTASFLRRLQPGAEEPAVSLAAGEGSYLYLLGPALKSFATRAAPQQLRLLTRDREGTLEAVTLGAAQLGVTSLDTLPSHLTHELLASVPMRLVLPKRHPLVKKRKLAMRDLDGARLIVPPADRPHRTLVTQAMRTAGADWTVAVEANGWELMLHFASLGLGFAIVNGCCTIPNELASFPLMELPCTRYYLLSRHGMEQDSPAGRLRSALLATTRRWRRERPARRPLRPIRRPLPARRSRRSH